MVRRKDVRIFEENLMERKEKPGLHTAREAVTPACSPASGSGKPLPPRLAHSPRPQCPLSVYRVAAWAVCSAQRCPLPRPTGHFPLGVWQSTLAQKPTCSVPSWRRPLGNIPSQQLALSLPSLTAGFDQSASRQLLEAAPCPPCKA